MGSLTGLPGFQRWKKSALTSRAGKVTHGVAGENYEEGVAGEGGEAEDAMGGLVEFGFEFGEWEGEGEEVILRGRGGGCIWGRYCCICI